MKSLEEMRKSKGFTLEDMAKKIDVTISSYYMYEKGERQIPADKAEAIAKILKVKKESIFLPAKFTVSRKV